MAGSLPEENPLSGTAPDPEKHRRFPVLEGILPLDRQRIPTDVIAGITLAALGIPEVMGYATIAGMPVVTGLYTILIPIAVFALLGSSRHLVVGADSATAAILAAGLAGMAPAGSAQYVQLASALAIATAGFLILARLIRLGFLADFLSRTVLIGFLTGVGIQVACGQVAGMLGVTKGTGRTLASLWGTLENIGQTSWWTLGVSLSVLAVILGFKRWAPRLPGALIAVIGSIIASYALNLPSHGVTTLGTVPSGLPSFGIPDVTWHQVTSLLPTAASLFLVILAQSAATSRAYAARYNEAFNENVDLIGLGIANISAGLSGTFVVNGSPTKTQMVDGAGGKSQISQLTTAVIVLIVILFLTVPLGHMPNAVLSSVVFLIGVELIDVKGMRRIFSERFDEFVVATITAAVVVTIGVEQGILLAIVLSLIDHIRRSYYPRDGVITMKDGKIHMAGVTPGGAIVDGLVVYRFASSLYYANTNLFNQEVLGLIGEVHPPVEWFCIEAAAIADVDWSAGQALKSVHEELVGRNVRLVFAEMADDVRAELDRFGITALVGEDAFYETVQDVVDAFGRRTSQA